MITGQCECGGVRFQMPEARQEITICHCSQCRRTSGHLWAATNAPFDSLTFLNDDTLTWYTSSDFAKRGFCNRCGSSLFYRMTGEAGIGIAAGCLDDTSGMRVGKHIFVKDKGDYYAIAEEEPQIQRF